MVLTRVAFFVTVVLAIFFAAVLTVGTPVGETPRSSSLRAPAAPRVSRPTEEVQAAIDVRAFIYCTTPLTNESAEWSFSVSKAPGVSLSCSFFPQTCVENIEMGNPDGSVYYMAVLKGTIVISRSLGSSLPIAFYPSSNLMYREDLPGESQGGKPVVVIEAVLTQGGVEIVWSSQNIEMDHCRVLFKMIEPGVEESAPLICALSSPQA
ncbi:MAG: hypothetical protein WC712_09085 [Candidatus Brocadiia bacterium]